MFRNDEPIVLTVDAHSTPLADTNSESARTQSAIDPGFDDEHKPAGWVLRYCGINKEHYFADPASTHCLCGYRIGSE